jgi:cytochrome b561
MVFSVTIDRARLYATMTLPQRYTRIAIALHWLVAVLIGANLVLVWSVDAVPDAYVRPIIDTHKSIGITVLGLAVLRLLWRVTHAPPPLPTRYQLWEQRLSHWAHIGLYVLIFAMPLTGWMHDSAWKAASTHPMYLFGIVPWPRIGWIMNLDPATKETLHGIFGETHEALGKVLYVFVAAHIVGALKHQFIDREPELQRMMPERRS